jgi:TPR repeat protein
MQAAGSGSSDAMVQLGRLAYKRKDSGAYERWYHQAAEAGNLEAMEHLSKTPSEESGEWERRLEAARPCKPRYHSQKTGATLGALIFRITTAG